MNWLKRIFSAKSEADRNEAIADAKADYRYSDKAHYKRTLGSLTKAQIDARNAKAAATKRMNNAVRKASEKVGL